VAIGSISVGAVGSISVGAIAPALWASNRTLFVQVTDEFQERGELMADVWIGYTTILETVMERMHHLCLTDRDRYGARQVSAKPSCIWTRQRLVGMIGATFCSGHGMSTMVV